MRLSPLVARERFAAAPVARLATADASGVPHAVPVTFAVRDGLLYFAVDHKPKSTWQLRRLRNIRANPSVTVLVDHYADDWSTLWWARADGRGSGQRRASRTAVTRRGVRPPRPQGAAPL
ncbi:TIGR03668 family PPOX class F420-dependent oxidoreductase [Streptomyces sp. SP18BB07]|uniref:TIGR03668 family PPOX class F420-dependent oxidoreductase n=1 Tax=Streptomyces sp. SP18BB07 TaxID=3002522 RepID=UPI002E78A339|nr:TIGR03668 family PPOX class F420-dependent oxidoreductase [Streptomyces sp. SP18BB07]MEE1762531.1 TIGR03668 family PPOX class F420-dependent oxidoreductase [Streptomyces sp. SP18BB07]